VLEVEGAMLNARRSQADMLRNAGMQQRDNGDSHLAAVTLCEAALVAEGHDFERRRMNAIRALNSLKQCPQPIATLTRRSGAVDELIFHPSRRWLLIRPRYARYADEIWNPDHDTPHRFPEELGEVAGLG
jgi:hypothetical protein